ncbi:MAG: gliding motility-associated ABC transporter substrate-binding protein GldG [Bacteroidales bacterium]|nr:gliding motility-associated ABC transporter substrate-binding protein GldG [Bacteroidales bacterium]
MSKKKDIRRQNIIQLLLGLVIIVLINIIGQYYFTRFDLTSEKKYTLSETTKKIVRSFDDYVTFKVYLEGDFPAGFKRLQRETKEMLDEFHAYNSNIQYEFINPTELNDQSDRNSFYAELAQKGLEPTNIRMDEKGKQSQQVVFPGAVVSYKSNREEAINLLESSMNTSPDQQINLSIQALEYNLTSTLKKLSNPEKENIAFLHGHGELPKIRLDGADKVLSGFYNVTHLITENKVNSLIKRNINDSSGKVLTEPRFKALIIAHPTRSFNEREKFLIDQYVMHGGKILWLVDPVQTNMDSLQSKPSTLAMPSDLNLDDMLFRYGVRLNKNLIKDLRSAKIPLNTQPRGSKPQFEYFPWPYFPILLSHNEHPIVKNLNGIKGKFVSTLDTISGNNIKKTMLLKSSANSNVISTPHEISLRTIGRRPDRRQYNKGSQDVAVLLEGKFTSVFKNRVPPQITQNKEMAFRTESTPNQMIIVADGDVIKNDISVRGNEPLPLGVDRWSGRKFGNEDFILNAVNYLCDDSGLLNLRDRDLKNRIMDLPRIEEEKTKWQVINIAGPVLLILIMSFAWNITRRRKFNRKS